MQIATDQSRTYLQGFFAKECYADVASTRQAAVQRLIRNNYFWQGFHYAAPMQYANNRIEWAPVGSQGQNDSGGRAYNSSLNFYKGDAKKLIGVLGRTPNAWASAIHQRDDESVADAEEAQKIVEELRTHWDVETLNAYIVFCLWTCGPVYGYTPYGADKKRFGVTEIQDYKLEPLQMEDGTIEMIPVPMEPEQFANGSVSLILCTDYDVIKPTRMKTLAQAPWLIYEHEVHKAVLMEKYPETKDPMVYAKVAGTYQGNDNYGRTARDQAASTTAFNRPISTNYWTESLIWLQPEMYNIMEVERNAPPELLRVLRAEHPEGAKVTAINGYPIRLEPESLHEVWFECPAEVGHSLDEPALGDETARMNRFIDDMFNVQAEVAEKGNPFTLYDPQRIDPLAIQTHASNPVDFIPVATAAGGNLRDGIWTSTPVEIPEAAVRLLDLAKFSMRENSGVTPALSGSETKQQTLGEAEINRNMALLPHNVTWNFMRRFWSGVYTNAVVQLAKYGLSSVSFGGERGAPPKQIDVPRLREILKRRWKIETEEAIPMTWGQLRAQVFQLLNMPPEILQNMGIMEPRNVKAMMKVLGTRDFVLPTEEQRDKTLADIAELMREQPIQQMTPMGPQTLCSRPPDDFVDDPNLVVQTIRDWAISKSGREAKEINPGGYANVILFGQEYQSIAQAMMMPPPMDGSAPGGAPPPMPDQSLASPPPSGVDPTSPLVPEELAGSFLEGA